MNKKGRGMRTSESISKCLECGHVDESKNFSASVTRESHVRLCPHCRAREPDILHNLKDYVLPWVTRKLWSIQYTVINNEFGHYAVADRITGTRLSTWGSQGHAIDEFRSTERRLRRLGGDYESRDKRLGPA
jgi:hypothetical protein